MDMEKSVRDETDKMLQTVAFGAAHSVDDCNKLFECFALVILCPGRGSDRQQEADRSADSRRLWPEQ